MLERVINGIPMKIVDHGTFLAVTMTLGPGQEIEIPEHDPTEDCFTVYGSLALVLNGVQGEYFSHPGWRGDHNSVTSLFAERGVDISNGWPKLLYRIGPEGAKWVCIVPKEGHAIPPNARDLVDLS